MLRGFGRAGLLTLAVVTLAAPAAARQESASLKGVVFDPTNRLVPAVTVTLTAVNAPSEVHTTKTDGLGRYEFTDLRPGLYRFDASQIGFRTVTVEITVAGNAEQSVRMTVGRLREELEITAAGNAGARPGRAISPEEGRGGSEASAPDPCASGRPGRVGGLITPPRKTWHVSPHYPDTLRQARLGGTVELRATVGVDGRVTGLLSPEPAGSVLLDATAAAVSQWRFQPAMLNCEPVAIEMIVVARFNPNR